MCINFAGSFICVIIHYKFNVSDLRPMSESQGLGFRHHTQHAELNMVLMVACGIGKREEGGTGWESGWEGG